MKKIYYFDPDGGGLYVFPDSPKIPDASVEISLDTYSNFAGVAWPTGKILGANIVGEPVWIDAPPMSYEEVVMSANAHKQALIDQANAYMNNKQWPGKAAIGRLQGDDLAQYNAWLDYLDALDVIDTSEAPDLTWPVSPSQ
ncbi:tail fiber assembly protein [Pseudescherichia vulneris]